MVGRAGFGGKIVHSESCWSIVILRWKMAYYEVMVVMRVVDFLWAGSRVVVNWMEKGGGDIC